MKEKFRAAAVHLIVNALVTGLLLLVLVHFWYPMPFFVADGGWQGFRLVAGLEVGLGPLLSLIVFRKDKGRRALAFDYGVIATLQLAVIVFGMWTIFSHRTVLAVFADGAFYSVDAEAAAHFGSRGAAIRSDASSPVAYGVVPLAADPEQRQRMRKEAMATGQPLYLRADLITPLDTNSIDELLKYQLDLEKTAENLHEEKLLADFRREHAEGWNRLFFVPVVCRYKRFVLALDRADGAPVTWLDLAVAPPYPVKTSLRPDRTEPALPEPR